MTKHLHRCMKCGYSLESAEPGLCFPCFVADAKAKMSIATASASAQVPRVRLAEKQAIVEETLPTSLREISGINKTSKSKKSSKSKKTTPKVHVAPEGWQPTRSGAKKPGKRPIWLRCALCGKGIAEGEMLTHTRMAHGEKFLSPLTSGSQGKSLWVTFVQGGLPGLGKRR